MTLTATLATMPSTPPSPPRALAARPRRLWAWALALTALLLWTQLLLPLAQAHLRATALLVRAAGMRSRVGELYHSEVRTEDRTLATPHGALRVRVYSPADGRAHRAIVLAHGVHYLGIDEPRLLPFARNLASAGFVVVTPHLEALADYRIAQSTVDSLRDTVRWTEAQPFASPGGVGMIGLSFAGGLSLVTAATPELREHIAFVLSVGGHHDLERVMRFLATDQLVLPEGTRPMHAHDYGLVVYFYANAERYVQGPQLPLFREALRQVLRVDHAAGARVAQGLTGEARTLFDQVNRNDKPALAPLVLRELPSLRAGMASLSPAGQLSRVSAPVFLLHGARDDVMPPCEPEMVARELAPRGDVHVVLTTAVSHVSVDGALSHGDALRIVHLMAGALGR